MTLRVALLSAVAWVALFDGSCSYPTHARGEVIT